MFRLRPVAARHERARSYLDVLSPTLLSLPAALATALLVAHTVRHRGAPVVALVVTLCLLWYVPKELAIQQQALAWHQYVFAAGMLRIGGIPPTVIVGHLFTVLVGWYFSERITRFLPGCRGYLLPTLVVWMLVASSVAYVMEVTGVTAGWWWWRFRDQIWAEMPLAARTEVNLGIITPTIPSMPIAGWAIYMFPLATVLLSFAFGPYRRVRARPLWGLALFAIYFVVCLRGLATFVLLLAALPLSLVSRMRYDVPEQPIAGKSAWARMLRCAPWIAVAAMLATSGMVLLLARREPRLLVSWMPILTVLAIAAAGRFALLAALVASLLFGVAVAAGERSMTLPLVWSVLMVAMPIIRILLAGIPRDPTHATRTSAVSLDAAATAKITRLRRGYCAVAALALVAHVTLDGLPMYLPKGNAIAAASSLITALLLAATLRDREVLASVPRVVTRGVTLVTALALLAHLEAPLSIHPEVILRPISFWATLVASAAAIWMQLRVARLVRPAETISAA